MTCVHVCVKFELARNKIVACSTVDRMMSSKLTYNANNHYNDYNAYVTSGNVYYQWYYLQLGTFYITQIGGSEVLAPVTFPIIYKYKYK